MLIGFGNRPTKYSFPRIHIRDNIYSFKIVLNRRIALMKTFRFCLLASLIVCLVLSATSCGVFGPKQGCPSNGKNVGAERILSGEKVPKAKKFKS